MIAENGKKITLKPGGSLRDISPTILGMLGIPQPKDMSGHDLRVAPKI
jgi:2,3-bisphosphoglycerate-independent phosphoglycerate mutase